MFIKFICCRIEPLLPVNRDEQRSVLNTAMVLPGSLQACNFLDKRGLASWDQFVFIMGTVSAIYLFTAARSGKNFV